MIESLLLAASLANLVGPCMPEFPPEATVITMAMPRAAYERERDRRGIAPGVPGFYFRMMGTDTHYIVLPNDAMTPFCHETDHVRHGPTHPEDRAR